MRSRRCLVPMKATYRVSFVSESKYLQSVEMSMPCSHLQGITSSAHNSRGQVQWLRTITSAEVLRAKFASLRSRQVDSCIWPC